MNVLNARILQETYFDNLVLNSMIAPEYGYEISLGTVESSIGNIREIYFALEGRELRSEREEHNQERECFNLVYPLTFSMPDGTEIVVDHHQDWNEIRQWYEQNPDATERYFQYPVNIIYEDGTIVSIANEENLIQAYEDCGQ